MYNKYRYYNATTYYIGITLIVIRTRTYNRGIITQGTFDSSPWDTPTNIQKNRN